MKFICVLGLMVCVLSGCAATRGHSAAPSSTETMSLSQLVSSGHDSALFEVTPAREGIVETEREAVLTETDRRVVRLVGLSEQVWERDERGWRLMSEVDVKDEVQLVYTPGMLLLPDRAAGAEPVVSTGDVVVRRLADGSLRASGQYETRVTAERSGEGVTVIERRSMGLTLASVDVEVWSDYDGRGLLQERESRVTTRVLGLVPDVEVRGLRRVK
ncbi:hypothetical protein [Mucisphaera sp.]|uniref:hypothetical protein n=1 Tax=Mucisphaera sp. TaxID=2913024 RepID=UPI003D1165E0